MTAALACGSCGTELSEKAKFCSECGAPVTFTTRGSPHHRVELRILQHQLAEVVSVGGLPLSGGR